MENQSGMTGVDVDQLRAQGRQAATQVFDQARDQFRGQISDQKTRAAESLGGVAQALRTTGEQLRQTEQAPISQFADSAAGMVDNVAGYLRQHEVEDVVADVQDFARRQPALFFGSAFCLGFMAVRFLKSSNGGYYTSRDLPARMQDVRPMGQSQGTPLPSAYDRAMEQARSQPAQATSEPMGASSSGMGSSYTAQTGSMADMDSEEAEYAETSTLP